MTDLSSINAHWIDLVVVVGYLVATFVIGLLAVRWFSDDSSRGEEAYYLAGRRVPGWLNGVSVAVTAMNADVAPFYCGLAVVIGLPMAWFYLSRFAVAWMILAVLFAVRWRQLNIRTGPEFYQLRFGGTGARFVRAYTAAFAVIVNMVPWMGAGLLGVHKIMAPIFGYEQKFITLGFALPVLLLYVWISGFAGVLVTDVFQSGVILMASLVLLISVLVESGGPQGLATAIQASMPNDATEVFSVFPVPGHEVLGPLVVLAWFLVPTIGQGGNLDLMGQRILSCRSNRDAAVVPIWAECTLFAMLLLLTLPVLGILTERPELYHTPPQQREEVYGLLLHRYLPTGFLGLALAALLASVMSTLSSYFNYGAQTLVNDVYRQVAPQARWLKEDSSAALWIGRLTTLLMVCGAVAVVFAASSLSQIAVILVGMVGSTASLYWGQWWWWRVNFWSWITAMVGGPLVYWLLALVLPQWPWWQAQLDRSEAMQETMGMLRAVIAMGLTSGLWITASLVTRPLAMSQLKSFYLRARPMGLWGPVRAAVIEDGADSATLPGPGMLSAGFGLALLGGISISMAIVGISQLMIANYQIAALLAVGTCVASFIFRSLFRRYLLRLDVD